MTEYQPEKRQKIAHFMPKVSPQLARDAILPLLSNASKEELPRSTIRLSSAWMRTIGEDQAGLSTERALRASLPPNISNPDSRHIPSAIDHGYVFTPNIGDLNGVPQPFSFESSRSVDTDFSDIETTLGGKLQIFLKVHFPPASELGGTLLRHVLPMPKHDVFAKPEDVERDKKRYMRNAASLFYRMNIDDLAPKMKNHAAILGQLAHTNARLVDHTSYYVDGVATRIATPARSSKPPQNTEFLVLK